MKNALLALLLAGGTAAYVSRNSAGMTELRGKARRFWGELSGDPLDEFRGDFEQAGARVESAFEGATDGDGRSPAREAPEEARRWA